MQPFEPLFRNAHLLTIAGNFWPRPLVEERFPIEAKLYQTEPDVRILVHTQQPEGPPRGEVVLVHGLEGSSLSGYAVSMAHSALEAGFVVNRFNMRGCGGTEALAPTPYHSGQTSDLANVVQRIHERSGLPIFLAGFSLGGNVALKLAGEWGERARGIITGVCAVSTPIDLAACARRLEHPGNFLYQWRFLSRLKRRVRLRNKLDPDRYRIEPLASVKTIWQFDDVYTAQFFGFGSADNYYRTQSSQRFLDTIAVPALLIQAKDDPLIPFGVFNHPAFAANPNLTLLAVEHGGHLGFLSREDPRFWLDAVVLNWISHLRNKVDADFVT